MPENPYETPRHSGEHPGFRQATMRWDPLLIAGGILAGMNLLTCLSVGIREILVYLDPIPALVIWLGGFVAGMIVLPALTSVQDGRSWRVATIVFLAAMELTWLFNIAIGAFCRGPNWNFYWPWEEHDEFRVVALNNVSFCEYFWHELGFAAQPAFWLVRELRGLVLVAGWLFIIPLVATYLVRSSSKRSRGFLSCLGAFAWGQLMTLLPLKMLMAVFNFDYLVNIHEFLWNL
jgi:hypothetical protein